MRDHSHAIGSFMIRVLVFILIFKISTAHALTDKLYIYTWYDSIPDEVIKKFTEETGINVILSSYENNETMYAKIKLLGQQSSYDIVSPSTYFVSKMAKGNLLEELDKSKIPNFKFINKNVLNFNFDPDNKFSIPYAVYLTGISYNAKYVTDKVDSWNNLFEAQYKNKILLLDDVREVLHIGLNLLGYDVNSVNETEIKAAYKKLCTILPNVRLLSSDSTKVNFLNCEVVIGMNWNADAYQAMVEDDNLKFVYPKEGAIFSMDTFAILKNAKNKENAYRFINFIHRPDVAKDVIEILGMSIPNDEAKKLVKPILQNNEVIFPKPETIKNSIIHGEIGNNIEIYNKYWEVLKVEN